MTATVRSDVETADPVVPGWPAPDPASPGTVDRLSRLLPPAAVVALAVAVVLRFVCRSQLWLDEAQGVAIARAPLHTLLASLRIDGSPPVYYVLLHGWMAVFGTGTWAVRALSGVFSVATLPLAWLLARRLVGRSEAVATVLLLASSPFAVHFATEARMYSLVMALTAVGGLALLRVLDRPGWWPVAGIGVCSGLLALTHYWSFYLLAVLGIGLLLAYWRGERARRPGYRRALIGLLSGGLLFLPWLPIFFFQSLHTGAPWGVPTSVGRIVDTVLAWAGSGGLAGRTAGVLLLG
ncbi:MAG: glycosyltransferase family 39 protein, partial [Actinomycetota bacterium]|nr:glycosyltransferase family 39 protein [Actinomycetota bacterium]